MKKNDFLRKKIPSILLFIGVILYIVYLLSNINPYINLTLALISYLLLGWDILLRSFRSFINKDFFNENTLMAMATLGSIILEQYAEAIGVMLFYKIGEFLQEKAVDRSYDSIQKLFQNQSDYTSVLRNNNWESVLTASINVDEIILVRKGDMVPLDGIIIKGNTILDTSSLTGESIPTPVSKNDNIKSGTINIGNSIEVLVKYAYKDSSIQKLLEIVELGLEKKSKTENLITKLARIYTPIVFFIALLVFIVPILFGGVWQYWLEKSIMFLVISCPCALVLSIPLTFFTALGYSSRKGILIKSSASLELLAGVKNIAFDKTGTLTKGKFSIIQHISNTPKEDLDILAALEVNSSHPIGIAIQEYYKDTYGNIPFIGGFSNIQEIMGKGIIAVFNQKEILVGSKQLLEDNNIEIQNFTDKINTIGSHIYFAIDKVVSSILVLADTIKPSSTEAIRLLKNKYINISILSGDHKQAVEDIAQQINIKNYYYMLSPETKVSYIEKLKNLGITSFVGDGINDAPVLSMADIGIAMGNSADISLETADIIISNDCLLKIPEALHISKRTIKIAKQNIFLALFTKIGFMTLTLLGLSNIWEGIFADVGVALLTVVNSIKRIK